MATEVSKSSRGRHRLVSESSDESVGTEDDRVEAHTRSDQSTDEADVSGCTLDVDVEGDDSPEKVHKHVAHGHAETKRTRGVPCQHDVSGDRDTVLHQRTETMVRKPLHEKGSARTKDSYSEYISRCTVISKPRDDSTNSGVSFYVAGLAALAMVSFAAITCSVYEPAQVKTNSGSPESSGITQEKYLEAFSRVQESLHVQTSGFWGLIRAAAKPIVLQRDPDQPAAFVLVIPSDAQKTAECFLRLFSSTLTNLLQSKSPVEFFADKVSSLPPARAKRLLDDQFRHGLGEGSLVAVVGHLEQLHAEAAMMLHAYCDNENAPFHRAIFVLTLFVEETSSQVSETESFAEERLHTLWADALGTNRFHPLMTRIAHTIAFIRPETDETLAQINC